MILLSGTISWKTIAIIGVVLYLIYKGQSSNKKSNPLDDLVNSPWKADDDHRNKKK